MFNVGTMDRVVRIVAGLAMLGLGFGGIVTGTAGTILKFAGFVPLFTAAVGFCPLYLPLGLSTRARK
ncbi:MAG: hypothetical protein RL173_285 [Fibrobacterota bacterium]|jgi:hypothetical protein